MNDAQTRHNARRNRKFGWQQWGELIFLGVFALGLFILGGIIIWASFVPIPAINNFEDRQVAQSTKIYDRTGNIVLYDVHGQVRRTAVPLTEISPYVQKASISIEDSTFYENAGFRPLAFLRALWVDITTGSYAEGGSTITQQVVKNGLLSQDKTIGRKIEEIILAIRLTKAYTKDQILNTYLNESPYGGTIYGVQEASQYFFGVDAKDVDLAQAAYLAALPQSPTFYSPYGNHKAALDRRKDFVLERMNELGYIAEEQLNQAKTEQVQFRDESQASAGIKAPHFVFYIQDYLEQKYGIDTVNNGGLKVVTTLDYDLQEKAESLVSKYGPQMQSQFNASNEGIVAIDPTTGQILAMVGSRDYFNSSIQGQYNVALANRQPGSSFKPLVYATAFEKGYTPSTVVFDLQTQFSTACAPSDVANSNPPCYSPQNYDGTFKGPMTFRDALAQSENIPAIKALYLAGIANSIKTAQDFGITTLGDPGRYGLTLVLGGGEVNLLEMTGAYGVFANDGVKNPPVGILEVRDSSGHILESYKNQATRVIDPQIAREITDVLSDNTARIPEFGADSPLFFSQATVADKTGTTNDSRDAWVIGYTPGVVVGAWAGNNDNSPMIKKIAAFILAPLWHDVMVYAIQKYPANEFPTPAPIDPSTIPPVLNGNWNSNPSQGIHNILYWVNKDNPLGGGQASAGSDPQFPYWEYPVQLWASQSGYSSQQGGVLSSNGSPASTNTPLHFISPQSGSSVSSFTPITAEVSSGATISSVSYMLDGQFVGSSSAAPFKITFLPSSHGPATLQASAVMNDGSKQTTSVSFTIQ